MSALTHEALIYASDEQFLAAMVPFLKAGLDANEGVVVAAAERNARALTSALGSDADRVVFVPSDDVYRSPVAAMDAYDQVIADHLGRGFRSIRAIGEVFSGPRRTEHEGWLRYEPIAHQVFADDPLHVVCPYDARALPGGLIEHARQAHPLLRDDAMSKPSPRFVAPAEMLRAHPDPPITGNSVRPVMSLTARRGTLAESRRAMGLLLSEALPRERVDDATIAIGELLANGLRHGSGGTVSSDVWVDAHQVICRVSNLGPRIDDFVGYRRPPQPENGMMGLWIARRCADRLTIEHDDQGPVVTIMFRR